MEPTEDVAVRIREGLRDLLAEAGPAQHAVASRLGLGATDAQALQHLATGSHETGVVELSRLLRIRSASATSLVDRLEEAGHVRRSRHPSDGRRITLAVTESAQAEVLAVLAPLLADVEELTAGLSDEQAHTVADFLDAAVEVLRRYSRTGGGDR